LKEELGFRFERLTLKSESYQNADSGEEKAHMATPVKRKFSENQSRTGRIKVRLSATLARSLDV
jgi:hypothetical protein